MSTAIGGFVIGVVACTAFLIAAVLKMRRCDARVRAMLTRNADHVFARLLAEKRADRWKRRWQNTEAERLRWWMGEPLVAEGLGDVRRSDAYSRIMERLRAVGQASDDAPILERRAGGVEL